MDDLLKRIAQSSRRLATAEREIQSRGAAGASPTTVSLSHLGSVESTRGRARVCVSLLLKLHRSSLDRALAGRQLRAAIDAACASDRAERLPRDVLAECIVVSSGAADGRGAAARTAWSLHCAGLLPLDTLIAALGSGGGALGASSASDERRCAKRVRRDRLVGFADDLRALVRDGGLDAVAALRGIVLLAHSLARTTMTPTTTPTMRAAAPIAARLVEEVCSCALASPAAHLIAATAALRLLRVGTDAALAAEVRRLYLRQFRVLLSVAHASSAAAEHCATATLTAARSRLIGHVIDEFAALFGAAALPALVHEHIVRAADELAQPQPLRSSSGDATRVEETIAASARRCVNVAVAALVLRRSRLGDREDDAGGTDDALAAGGGTASVFDRLFDDAAAGLAAGAGAGAQLRTRHFFLVIMHQAFALARRCCGWGGTSDDAALVASRAVVAYEAWLQSRIEGVALTRSLVDGVVQVLTARVPFDPTDVLRAHLRAFKPLLSHQQLRAAADSEREFTVQNYVQLLRVRLSEFATSPGRAAGVGADAMDDSARSRGGQQQRPDSANADAVRFVEAFAKTTTVPRAVREAAMFRRKWWEGPCLRAILAPLEGGDADRSSPLSTMQYTLRCRFVDVLQSEGLIGITRYATHKAKRKSPEELEAAALAVAAAAAVSPSKRALAAAGMDLNDHLNALPGALMKEIAIERSEASGRRVKTRTAVPLAWVMRMTPIASRIKEDLRAGKVESQRLAKQLLEAIQKMSLSVEVRACSPAVWTKPVLTAVYNGGGAPLVCAMLRNARCFMGDGRAADTGEGASQACTRSALAATLGNAMRMWGPSDSGLPREAEVWTESVALLKSVCDARAAVALQFASDLFDAISAQGRVRKLTVQKLPLEVTQKLRWLAERAHFSSAGSVDEIAETLGLHLLETSAGSSSSSSGGTMPSSWPALSEFLQWERSVRGSAKSGDEQRLSFLRHVVFTHYAKSLSMSRVCAAIALALVGDAEEDCDGSTYLTLRLLLAEMNTLSLQGALRKREAWVPNVLHSLLGSAAVDFKLQRRQVNTFFHILGSMPGLHLGADADSRELVLGRVTSQLALFQMPWSTHVSAVLLREVALGGVSSFESGAGGGGDDLEVLSTAQRCAPALIVECARSLPLSRIDASESPAVLSHALRMMGVDDRETLAMLRALWRHLLCKDVADGSAAHAVVARLLNLNGHTLSAKEASLWRLRCDLAAPCIAYASVCQRQYRTRGRSSSGANSQGGTSVNERIGALVVDATTAAAAAAADDTEASSDSNNAHYLVLSMYRVLCALREGSHVSGPHANVEQCRSEQYAAIAAVGPTIELFATIVRSAPSTFAAALCLDADASQHERGHGGLSKLWSHALIELDAAVWRTVFSACGARAAGVLFEAIASRFIAAAPGATPSDDGAASTRVMSESRGGTTHSTEQLALLRRGLVSCVEGLPNKVFRGSAPGVLQQLQRCALDAEMRYRQRMRRSRSAETGSEMRHSVGENVRAASHPSKRSPATTAPRGVLGESQQQQQQRGQPEVRGAARHSRLSLSRKR